MSISAAAVFSFTRSVRTRLSVEFFTRALLYCIMPRTTIIILGR